MICCVCRRDREAHKTLILTDKEKAIVAWQTGESAPDTLSYCKACWQIATDQTQAIQLMKGMALLKQRRGVKGQA